MQLLIHTFDLALKYPFTISRRSFDHQENLIVELRDKNGLAGFGEATFNPYYPNTEVGEMKARLEALRPTIENYRLQDAAAFWDFIQPQLAGFPFAHCALDEAAHDLCARRAEMPLYVFWGLQKNNTIKSSLTLGIDAPEVLIARMKAMPWPVYKIKLGRPDDLEIIATLRQHTTAPFRVDANCAWTVNETIEKSKILARLGVEFIEQPLAADDWEGMKKVFAESALPVFADEACRTEKDLALCRDRFHGINIKLMKCGGLTPALRMIKQARRLGLQVMAGCMTESTVGISAIAQLLPLLDFADMDGPLFLQKDVASGVRISSEGIFLAEENGTGVRLL